MSEHPGGSDESAGGHALLPVACDLDASDQEPPTMTAPPHRSEPRTNPEVGLALVNPTAGTTIRFLPTAASTDGDHVEVEATYPPASARPPKHLHPSQEERFTVISGSLEVVCGEERFVASAGDEFVTAVGVPHQMWAGPDGAVFHWRTEPALRTGEMHCRLWECARDHGWDPSPLQLFEVVSGFADEFCLA